MRGSVVLDDAVIRAGAVIERAIVDVGTTVDVLDEGRRDERWSVTVFT